MVYNILIFNILACSFFLTTKLQKRRKINKRSLSFSGCREVVEKC